MTTQNKVLVAGIGAGVLGLGYYWHLKNQKEQETATADNYVAATTQAAIAAGTPATVATQTAQAAQVQQSQQVATTTAPVSSLNVNLLLQKGSKGNEVRELQSRLGFIGKGIDGDFGKLTLAALQKQKGVSQITLASFAVTKPSFVNNPAYVVPASIAKNTGIVAPKNTFTTNPAFVVPASIATPSVFKSYVTTPVATAKPFAVSSAFTAPAIQKTALPSQRFPSITKQPVRTAQQKAGAMAAISRGRSQMAVTQNNGARNPIVKNTKLTRFAGIRKADMFV